jgi:hypothetical protein
MPPDLEKKMWEWLKMEKRKLECLIAPNTWLFYSFSQTRYFPHVSGCKSINKTENSSTWNLEREAIGKERKKRKKK